MATNFQIWGSDGWQFLVRFLGGGDLSGISSGWGYNLAAVRALNAAIRAENRANRRQCWEAGHFVSRTGKCVSDPEIGVQKALEQLNGAGEDVFGPMSDLRRTRLEGYVANQFYREWDEAVESGEGSSIQSVIDKYGQYSDIMSTNPYIGGLSFNMANPQQVLDRMILGDSDWGATVQLCTTTVTTNCVDPTGIKDLWEDFGRHVQVIFKGLQIPGLPDWLPLPGIMRLPTLGEIWDKVIGPFQEEANAQMRECMSQDADGDGVPNTASYCIENRDIVGIITGTITGAAEEIYKETSDRIKDIVDGELEVPCVEDPQACAEKTKEVLGRIFEGVWDSADPTMPGIPDWVRAIIIAGEYGDEFLDVLEGILNQDVDGDGTIGITPTQEYCADGVTIKEDAEGTNCPEYAQFGYCADGTTKKQDAEGTNCAEYAPNGYCQDGTTIKSDAAGTNCPEYSEFGFCQDGTTKKQDAAGTNCSEYAEFGYCEDGTTKKEDSAGTNCSEYTPDYGMCDDGLTKKENADGTNCPGPEPVVNEGDPCDLENGGQGTYQYVGDDLQCLPEPPEFGFCQDGVTEKEDAEGTNCSEYAPFGYCQDNQTKKDNAQGTNCSEYSEFGYCSDGVTKKEDAQGTNCTEYAEFGYCEDGTTKKEDAEGTNCSEYVPPQQPIDCTQPRPTGTITFDLIDAQDRWDAACASTHCPQDGSLIESHVNSDCQLSLTSDCQDPQTDEQKRNCGWQECGTETANPGLLVESLDQCGAPQPQECVDDKGNPTGATNYPDCNVCPQGQIFNENGICADPTVDCSEITDANYEACGKEKCNDGTFADVGQCPTTLDCSEITDDNYEACGKEKCADGTFADIGGCLDPEGSCDNGAIDYPTCTECPDGSIPDAIDGCAGPTINCADYNQQTNDDGTCGPCLPGYVKDTSQPDEPCVAAPADPCPAGFALNTVNGLCEPVTCPEGESYCEATGQCETAENCPGPDDSGPDGSGGMLSGSGGGRNMFTPMEVSITGDPQLLSRQQFAEQDFLSPLFEGVNDFPIAQFLAGNRKA